MNASENAAPNDRATQSERAGVATAALDAQGKVIGWGRASGRLLGYGPQEVMGRPAVELLARPQDAAEARTAVERCRRDGGWAGSIALRHRDGQLLELSVQISALLNADGSECWFITARDKKHSSIDEAVRQMSRFLQQSPVGMAVLDTDLRFVWVNDVLEHSGTVPPDERIGRRIGQVLPGLDANTLEAEMRRVLKTGISLIDYEFHGRIPADPIREHAFWSSVFPLTDPGGRVLGVWYMVADVTDRWRAKERLTLLNEASERIGSTLDITRTAQDLVDVVVPRFADSAAVDVLESVLRGEEPTPGPAADGSVLKSAARQAGHETPEGSLDARTGLVTRSLSEGKAIMECAPDDPVGTPPIEARNRASTSSGDGVHSTMVVPVRARDMTLGVATFTRSRRPDPFEDDDVLLAEEIVTRAAICMDNARRFTREYTAALTLQRSLLPQVLTAGTALEVASRYYPAHGRSGVGGDWFDVIPLSGARVALVVGDVVGHGIDAAATMGRLRVAVRTLADLDPPPEELLARLDDLVINLMGTDCDEQAADDTDGEASERAGAGATCLYAVYDPITRRCTMARAGHLPPVLVWPDGTTTLPDLPAGPPLGLGALPFEAAELELPEGTLLALYTDGLVETRERDIDVSLDRLGKALSQPGRALNEICDSVVNSLVARPPSDDAALLIARTHVLDRRHVASWDFPTDPAIVGTARTLATRQLSEWGLDELQFSTELIVSELVTNALRYGAGPIRMRMIRERILICEISDASNTSPRLRHARASDEGGRGLFLVAQLARRWGVRYTEVGKIIWAEQALPSDLFSVA